MKVTSKTIIELTEYQADMLEEFITGNADLGLYDSSQPRDIEVTKFCLELARYLTR